MNKFIKFPLILAIVGVLCAGTLSVVYEITKEKIAYNNNKKAFDLLSGIITDMTDVKEVTKDYDSNKLKDANISTIYEVKNNSGITAYGYLAKTIGYTTQTPINFLLVLDANESIIRGFEVVSHAETNSGTYGGPLLNSPDFAAQFTDISFDEVSNVDYVAGSTAKVTMGAILTGVDNVTSFHRYELFGEVDDGINLTGTERKMLELPEGYVMSDKTEEFKSDLKGKTSDNAYKKILAELGLLNFVEIKDAAGNAKGHAYVVEGKYNCEVQHGERAWQEYKFVFMFDENEENSKLVVVKSTDSLGAINLPSIGNQPWINENFGGASLVDLNTALSNSNIDYIHGATFSSKAILANVTSIVSAHSRAYWD